MKKLTDLIRRHAQAFGYVITVILPVILRTGRRPVVFSRFTGMGDIICTIPAALELKKRHPGATFIYNCHPDFAAVPWLAGITGRVTSLRPIGLVGHWYACLLEGFYHFAHGDDLKNGGSKEPMVAEFLRQFGLPISEEHPKLAASPAAQQTALAVLQARNVGLDSLVLIHPGPSWPVKEWPRY